MAELSTTLQFTHLLETIRCHLHPRAYEIVENFLRYGELQVAAEHLCELLYEDKVVLPAAAYNDLIKLLSELRLDEQLKDILPALGNTID